MVTTLDIPDDVVKRAMLKAAHEGVSLKEFVVLVLKKDLDASDRNSVNHPWEALRNSGKADISPEESPWEQNEPPLHDPIWERPSE